MHGIDLVEDYILKIVTFLQIVTNSFDTVFHFSLIQSAKKSMPKAEMPKQCLRYSSS